MSIKNGFKVFLGALVFSILMSCIFYYLGFDYDAKIGRLSDNEIMRVVFCFSVGAIVSVYISSWAVDFLSFFIERVRNKK